MEEIERSITIDENNKIEIIPKNYVWKIRRMVKNNATGESQLEWITEGYYPDVVSICQSYIKDAPRNDTVSIRSIQGIIESVKKAEKTIENVFGLQVKN